MDSPLAPLAGMIAGAMGGPVSLPVMADQLEMLAGVTGYRSLLTLARGFREMHDEMENDTKVIQHDD